ncbi:SH3 domain-containing protein [Bacillus mycoides]|uniref:SH3 domain-containing protein n=1 Tax=Bacillus mycoides TaxID=1405 RepID=UPI003D6560AC
MTPSIGRIYIKGIHIKVRKGPSLKYEEIKQVNQPNTFLISQEQNDWLELEKTKGWVYYNRIYIKFLKNIDLFNGCGVATINGDGINVRKGPSKNNNVVKQFNKTDTITTYVVFKVFNGWLNVGGNQWIYYDPKYILYRSI